MRQYSNILIIRTSSIGDVIMASSMLPVLRQAYPHARLTWLVEPAYADLLRSNPLLDEVIPWSKGQWKQLGRQGRIGTLIREIVDLRRDLRRRSFDLVLDAQGLLRTRFIAWLAGGRESIGFDSREPGKFLLTNVLSKATESRQMGAEYLIMVRELGFDSRKFLPSIAVSSAAEASAATRMEQAKVKGPFAVFAPFTTRLQKEWQDGSWAALAQAVSEKLGLQAVIVGGGQDVGHADSIVDASQGKVVSLAGCTTIEETAAIVKNASIVIGVDTGITHMGTAFERPTVALFGSTCPYLSTASMRTTVLYHARDCSPCRRSPTCSGRFDCMSDITVADVLSAAGSLLVE